jgi:cyclopropane fatty-acyl-phospholipid synthase-like methyltransferase
MSESLKESLSESLETNPDFLPYLPELLQDLWELGSSPEKIIELIGPLGLDEVETRVLDLGCGKGAVSILLAKKFGFRAIGVDGCQPFLDEAWQKAREHGVEPRCDFIHADIKDYIQKARDFDIVIYASLGRVLGNISEYVGKLRTTLRPGGFMVVDDGFLKGSKPIHRKGYEHYLPHEETIQKLTSHGDTLIGEILLEEAENREIDQGYLKAIKHRSLGLLKRNPELRDEVEAYIKNQEIECEVIEQNLRGAVWLIRKK